ncbi:MAG: hypothetical protein WCX22_01255 [Methanoregula sp.]|jgi:archaellum biogenesis ATPase FlaH
MKITRELVEGIPGAKLVLVDGDHTISWTHPEFLLTQVDGFLEAVDAERERSGA